MLSLLLIQHCFFITCKNKFKVFIQNWNVWVLSHKLVVNIRSDQLRVLVVSHSLLLLLSEGVPEVRAYTEMKQSMILVDSIDVSLITIFRLDWNCSSVIPEDTASWFANCFNPK